MLNPIDLFELVEVGFEFTCLPQRGISDLISMTQDIQLLACRLELQAGIGQLNDYLDRHLGHGSAGGEASGLVRCGGAAGR